MEYFSLVPSANGECVKLLSENMLQSSAVAAATAIQGLGQHASNPDEPQPKVKVCSVLTILSISKSITVVVRSRIGTPFQDVDQRGGCGNS